MRRSASLLHNANIAARQDIHNRVAPRKIAQNDQHLNTLYESLTKVDKALDPKLQQFRQMQKQYNDLSKWSQELDSEYGMISDVLQGRGSYTVDTVVKRLKSFEYVADQLLNLVQDAPEATAAINGLKQTLQQLISAPPTPMQDQSDIE